MSFDDVSVYFAKKSVVDFHGFDVVVVVGLLLLLGAEFSEAVESELGDVQVRK